MHSYVRLSVYPDGTPKPTATWHRQQQKRPRVLRTTTGSKSISVVLCRSMSWYGIRHDGDDAMVATTIVGVAIYTVVRKKIALVFVCGAGGPK